MTIIRFVFFSMILLIFGNVKANAQEYEITLNCPDTVGANQQLKVSFKIFAKIKEFNVIPKSSFVISGGDVFSGPNQSISASAQVLNGKVVEYKSITYNYVLLSNYSQQDIIIEPMKFDVLQGNDVVAQLSTNKKIVKVIKDYMSSEEESTGVEQAHKKTPKQIHNAKDIAPGDVAFVWTTDKTEVTLGDTVLCNCDLYTQLQPVQLSRNTTLIDDCIILDDTLCNTELETVEYGGKECYHVRVQSFKIVPLHTGKFCIGGNTFELELVAETANTDPLDAFFNGIKADNIPYRTKSNQTFVKVKGKVCYDNKDISPGNDCFLLCDVSTSMTVNDIEPSRKSCVQAFVNEWINEIPETGFISFAGGVEQFYTPNQNLNSVTFLEEPLNDGTAIGNAMIAPISCGEKPRDIVIITDGANNSGYLSLKTAFDVINKYNVRVSYIYINSGKDSVDYVSKGVEETIRVKNEQAPDSELKFIQKMVQLTGGLFGVAHNKNELFAYLPKLQRLIASPKTRSRNNNELDDKILERFLNKFKEEVILVEREL